MAGAGQETNFEELAFEQRLKAATHFTVGQICEENAKTNPDIEFTQQFIAALSETTFKFIGTVATDLEAFAKHAKRTTINADDVKLLTRKSSQLNEHITDMATQLSTANEEKRAKAKRQKKKTTVQATSNPATDDDSNL